MAINKIITEKELNYIETLYLYANLEQFITKDSHALDWLIGENNQKTNKRITFKDVESLYAGEKYTHMLTYVHDTLLHDAKYLGDSHGRSWYELDNYKLGIMDYDKSKKANQFNVEIQYFQSHMFTLDPSLKGLELPFDGTLDHYHIKRIDVSQIVKTPNDYLTNHKFISPYRKEHRETKSELTETVYLGHRKNGNVFRMYNKTVELNVDTKDKPMNYSKIELFRSYFGDIDNLFTFELEMHRRHMKPTFGIDTLKDLKKVYQAYHEIVGKIKIYEDNDQNKKHVKNKDHDRVKFLQFTEYKEFARLTKKRYEPNKYHLVKRAEDMYNRFEASLKGDISMADKYFIADEFATAILGKQWNYEVTATEDTNEYNEMMEKHEKLRDGNDQLQSDANDAFRKANIQGWRDLF
jgi:hypothetical protein